MFGKPRIMLVAELAVDGVGGDREKERLLTAGMGFEYGPYVVLRFLVRTGQDLFEPLSAWILALVIVPNEVCGITCVPQERR